MTLHLDEGPQPTFLSPGVRVDKVAIVEAGVEIDVERRLLNLIAGGDRTPTDMWRIRASDGRMGLDVAGTLEEAIGHARTFARAVRARDVAYRDASDEYDRRVAAIPAPSE